MIYAKLIDSVLIFAPRKLPDGDYFIINPSPEKLAAAGYKPVRYTEAPEVEEGYVAVPGWEEQAEEIVQTWAVEPEPDEIDGERAAELMLGG